jgi:hypothetical protein
MDLLVMMAENLPRESAEVKFLFPSIDATVPGPRYPWHFVLLAHHKRQQAQSGLPLVLKTGKTIFS